MTSAIRGCKVTFTHRQTSRLYMVTGLTLEGADKITFDYDKNHDGRKVKMNIVDYFKSLYGINLRFPRLPCVIYGKGNRMPLELAVVAPFHPISAFKLTADQTAEMIKVAARPPFERREAINGWRRTLGYESLDKISAWGLDISPKMVSLTARVLNPPQVQYRGQGSIGLVRPNGGTWNLRGKRFFSNSKPLKSWAILSFDRWTDHAVMSKFATMLVSVLKSHGCDVPNGQPPCLGPFNPQSGVTSYLGDAARAAHKAGGGGDPQLIVVIMPTRDTALYESIKKSAALNLIKPVVTQCLQSAKIKNDRGLDQYCANVAMKVHSKLGGVTHTVPYGDLPGVSKTTMFIGADVTHPPGFQYQDDVPPSIAVTVATTNGVNNLYSATIRLQEGRTEPIADIMEMVKGHLLEFKKNTGKLPTNLIFYRDGVSEGQFAKIIELEVDGCRKACHAMDRAYSPKLTYIICAKRHNMRFFAASPNDADRTGNLPAGTVVDNTVTHPFAFDFYLQAHSGVVGTARPTHYSVLVDDNKFKPDDLQRLTNALCYNFARATRSVSIVSVAYMADIICTQARTIAFSDIYETSTTFSGHTPVSVSKTAFDPLKLTTALAKNPEWAKVAWYM